MSQSTAAPEALSRSRPAVCDSANGLSSGGNADGSSSTRPPRPSERFANSPISSRRDTPASVMPWTRASDALTKNPSSRPARARASGPGTGLTALTTASWPRTIEGISRASVTSPPTTDTPSATR